MSGYVYGASTRGKKPLTLTEGQKVHRLTQIAKEQAEEISRLQGLVRSLVKAREAEKAAYGEKLEEHTRTVYRLTAEVDGTRAQLQDARREISVLEGNAETVAFEGYLAPGVIEELKGLCR